MAEKFTVEQIAQAIKRRDPRLKDVPDADLVRGLIERRPDVLGLIQTSEPRPPLGNQTSSPRPPLGLLENISVMQLSPQIKQRLFDLIRQKMAAASDTTPGLAAREALKQTFSALLENKSAEHRAQDLEPYPIEEYGYRSPTPAPPKGWWQQLPGAKRGE